MATVHYTPTHCPDTGRKFTRSERKAANKARFKAEMAKAAKARKAPKPTTLREAVELVNGTAERHFTQGTEASKQALEQAKANLREVEAAKSKPKRKPAKAGKPTKASLMRLTKAQLVDLLFKVSSGDDLALPAKAEAPKRKPKRKSAPKARKATPSQRVADRQERVHHGRPDTPVTPQAEAHTADVDAARKAARETGARNRKRQAFDLATMWAFSTAHGGVYTEGQQAELTRLLGSTDVSTYEDVVALTH
jgi:hypothetical protein